jgi:hypothetical protein
MLLLAAVSIGLLSLSAVGLRASGNGEAVARARANARMALMMALGQLQVHVGDDRRVTADASLLGGARRDVGVWESWSPRMTEDPSKAAPDYQAQKNSSFRGWLGSCPDPVLLQDREWVTRPPMGRGVRLFKAVNDGFDLDAAMIALRGGGLAWSVTQENTRAKLNIAGDSGERAGNRALHVQPRPSVALSEVLRQPAGSEDEWSLRSARFASIGQTLLEPDMVKDPARLAAAAASYTMHATGVLCDVVNGGLKTDLSLGFALDETDFAKSAWEGVSNPFRGGGSGAAAASAPAGYLGQRALFRPLVENPMVAIDTNYSPASVTHRFCAAGVPTMDHLRSHYRIPWHLYGGSAPVVAERAADHAGAKAPPVMRGSYATPARPPAGLQSRTGIRPVLNRLVYLLSASLSPDNQTELVITPVVSLWNPYNTALEIEGAVAYPWMDLPFQIEWQFKTATAAIGRKEVNLSMLMGKQFEAKAHGRSVDPYFFCEMTANGDGSLTKPIRFAPGEVRLFVPSSTQVVRFVRTGSNAQRTVRMRPVEDLSQMNTAGGLAVPMRDGVRTNGVAHGFTYVVKPGDSTAVRVRPSSTSGQYHYFVSLEDATRIRDKSATAAGEAVTDVQMLSFVSAVNEVASPQLAFADLKRAPQPFAVIETFHRTAVQSVGGQPNADLLYTTNPRQASINHQLAAGSFAVAPHFQSTLRAAASFDGAIQTSIDGRCSFWGSSHSASGRSVLPFFEIPREPLLSLAAFQHADLSSSTFAPANQFANSWANPYLAKSRVASIETRFATAGVPVYDSSYLANEALWDGFFFSGASPRLAPASSGEPSSAWKSPIATSAKPIDEVMRDFVNDPLTHPLANPRLRLHPAGRTPDELIERLTGPAACTRIAGHLLADGAFNINSTDVEAWTAQLGALRGETYQLGDAPSGESTRTPMSRFRHPMGKANDNWNGPRTLDDEQVRELARRITAEVVRRGPFQSLAEFVNRRVEDSELGRAGAIQSAIDAAALNRGAAQAPFSVDRYPSAAKSHIVADTGVGIPGFLTQADVLQSLGSVITCRSDSFTIRAYGESLDASGRLQARACCEAVVRRVPGFIDPADAPETALDKVKPVNRLFGRRIEVVAFRWLAAGEFA